jgi:hypothetical protein
MNANHIKQLSKAIDVDENTLMEACFKTYHNWKNKIDSVDEFIEEF